MERFESKIDHNLNVLLKNDVEKAQEIWKHLVTVRKNLLETATKIIADKNGDNKTVFLPSICHMILSNPQDVDVKFYNLFANMILNDQELSRLAVVDNLSFASLIAIYGSYYLDDRSIQKLSSEIINKAVKKPYLIRRVNYNEITNDGDKNNRFRDNILNIMLSNKAVNAYAKREHINIEKTINFDEVDILMNYAANCDDLNPSLKNAINSLYQDSLNYRVDLDQTYGIDEETPKL